MSEDFREGCVCDQLRNPEYQKKCLNKGMCMFENPIPVWGAGNLRPPVDKRILVGVMTDYFNDVPLKDICFKWGVSSALIYQKLNRAGISTRRDKALSGSRRLEAARTVKALSRSSTGRKLIPYAGKE